MANFFSQFNIPPAQAICYSGFRDGQQPGGKQPSYQEIKEDLLLLTPHFRYLRLYDCDAHAQTVIDVITKEQLPFKLMLGAYIEAEKNNFGCPWGGGVYSEEELQNNHLKNDNKINTLIEWANKYSNVVFCTSVGNEACVDWTDHYVSVDRVMAFTQKVNNSTKQPVTFCENYVPWLNKLKPIANVVDFISIQTYPVWEYKYIHEALDYTRSNYEMVVNLYPNIPIVITEAGWATNSNGRGINPEYINEENQKIYFEDLMQWSKQNNILTFYFEAFDENRKGSPDPNEPEKHWGLFKADRSPKRLFTVI